MITFQHSARWWSSLWPQRLPLRTIAPLVALSVAQLLYLLPDLFSPVSIYDEGYVVAAAERILRGQTPYRDFTVEWAPAQFYIIAALFKAFGLTLTVERTYDMVVRVVLSLAVWLVAARLTRSRLLAGLPWGFTTFMASPAFSFGYSVAPALALVLLAVWCVLRYYADPRASWLAGAGIAIGVATLFRHDFGFYACACAALMVALFQWRWVIAKQAAAPQRLISLVRLQMPLLLGIALPTVPVLAYFLALTPLATLWDNLIVLPRMNSTLYAVPLPGLVPAAAFMPPDASPLVYVVLFVVMSVPVNLPFPVAALCAAGVWRLARREFPNRTEVVWGLGLLLLLCIPFSHYAVSRISINHELPLYVLLAIVLTALLRYLPRTPSYRMTAALIGVTFLLFGLNHAVFDVAPYLLRSANWSAAGTQSVASCLSSREREGCATLHPDQRRAAQYLRDHTAPAEPVLSANPRYDQIYFQDMMVYFLAGRVPPTRHHDLLAGVATTLPVQQHLAQALEAHPVRYLVVYHGYDRWQEDSPAARSSGVTYLDDVIRAQYAPVEQFGDYVIWRRQGP